MKVFCKYCRFYEPLKMEQRYNHMGGPDGIEKIPADCKKKIEVKLGEPLTLQYDPETGLLRKDGLFTRKINTQENSEFNCKYYHTKWWIRQKAINRRERL